MKKEIIDKNELIDKVAKVSSDISSLDLSADEDLSIAIMNLISIEEHLFFTGSKTGKSKYYEMLSEVREIRKDLLRRIIHDYEGEVWCTSKHLLAASYRLIEFGSKLAAKGNNKDSQKIYEYAYNLYSLFWVINLKITE